MTSPTLVVVGAGHAGGRAVGALRAGGYDGRIVMLGDEADAPYERPPLSKQVLTADQDPMKAAIHPPSYYADNAIDLRLGERVDAVDTSRQRVTCSSGAMVDYTHLLLATGTRARVLPGIEPDGERVFALRSAADARLLRPRLREGTTVLLIGGGYIGLEVAASARALGCRVVVWEAQSRLLQRGFDERMSAVLLKRHIAQGVEVSCGVQVERLKRLTARCLVTASGGQRVEADLVIVGVGALPNEALARAAGIECANGVLVDSECRTSVPNVFAIGDVASQHSDFYGRRMRLESWENAEHQGQAVAHALLGKPSQALVAPWFWTDQFKDNWQLIGAPEVIEQVVIRGDPDSDQCISFGMHTGRIISAVLLNTPRARRPVKKLIEQRTSVDVTRLVNPDIPLEKVA